MIMLKPLQFPYDDKWNIPSDEECLRLWDKYQVLPNIREHSFTVTKVGDEIVNIIKSKGYTVNGPLIHAACLLHDIAKSYTLYYGGEHAQVGSAWALQDTGNPALAQAILFHVYYPWDSGDFKLDLNPLQALCLVAYADKRVRHNKIVSVQERFADILDRYGKTEFSRQIITENCHQTEKLELALIDILGDLKVLESV